MSAMAPIPATVGPFRVAGVLGRGRRATVYLASDGRADVALKVAASGDLASEQGALRACGHPAVVGVHGQGPGWIAMEYVQGGPLSRWAGQAVGEGRAAQWLRGAAQALAHVHAQGWVHRDVKPANLLLRADASLVLADFGEAVPAGAPSQSPGAVIGSPAYAAPEQRHGAAAHASADVYSLGVMLHEWLAGHPPFPAVTLQEALAQHWLAPVPRLAPALARWQPLLDALLAKKADARPQHAAAVLERIPT